MEISKLYEAAADRLEKAVDACGKSDINLSSLTVISTVTGNMYSGINWKTLSESFEEELTCSEDEAVCRMLLAGESEIEHIITLDPASKLPVNPCQKCLELIIRINPANCGCNVITGKNSKVILTSINSEISEYAEKIKAQLKMSDGTPAAADSTAAQAPEAPQAAAGVQAPSEPEGSASHAGIDASGLQMIFDDWESAEPADNAADSKPFSASSLTSTQAEVINQVQNMAGNPAGYQQQNTAGGGNNNNMYGGQPMNGMYQQQMNGMYQQQPMNGMYQQQPMNGMYQQPMNGMYQQQPMNGMYQQQPMNGMYQQPMNGMYQQPMNGMYQQPMNGMYGNNMYQQPNNGGRASLYLNNQNPAGQQSMYGNKPASANSSTYISKLQAPVSPSVANTQSVSVYGTNINESDNNAIFKDRLNNILNSSGSDKSKADETDIREAMMAATERKNAAKKNIKKN